MTARRRIGYKPFTTVGSSRASLPAPVPTVPSIPSSPDIPPREIVLSSAAATPLVSDAEDFVAPVIDTEHLDDSDSESGEDGTASPQSLAVSRLVRAKRDAMPSAPEPDDDEDESQFLISSMKRHAQPDGISSDAAVDVAATSVAAPVRDSFGLLSERAVDIPITGDGPASQHSTLRHYSTLDLELQGVSMGVCLVPLVGLWSPALAIPATPVASPSPQPTSARQRTPLSSRRRPQSAIKRVGSSSASPGTPAADSPFFGASTVPPLGAGYVPDILKEVMQDMETYGMGRDDESGVFLCMTDDFHVSVLVSFDYHFLPLCFVTSLSVYPTSSSLDL